MSLLSNRRALVLAGLSGILLAGATLATSTAAHADDGSTTADTKKTAPSDTAPSITINDAADAAESKYPDCDVTAALLYDTAESPVWDVELTCKSGTVKYATVDGETGTVADDGTRIDDTGSSDGSSSTSDDDWWSTTDGDDTAKSDKSTGKDDKQTAADKSADNGDAPGTGANTDYS